MLLTLNIAFAYCSNAFIIDFEQVIVNCAFTMYAFNNRQSMRSASNERNFIKKVSVYHK